MPDVPSQIPAELIAGNTWIWDRDYADYSSSSWTATAYFENQSKTFNVVGTAEGTAHRFSIAAATTATYPAGRYRVRVRVTDGSQVFIAESAWVVVQVDPAAAGTRDVRSWARRTLDELEACLEIFASTAQQSASVAGRSYARAELPSLIEWRDRLRSEVAGEESTGPGGRRTIKLRFKRA